MCYSLRGRQPFLIIPGQAVTSRLLCIRGSFILVQAYLPTSSLLPLPSPSPLPPPLPAPLFLFYSSFHNMRTYYFRFQSGVGVGEPCPQSKVELLTPEIVSRSPGFLSIANGFSRGNNGHHRRRRNRAMRAYACRNSQFSNSVSYVLTVCVHTYQ